MAATAFEPFLSQATVKAIDGVAKKMSGASKGSKVAKLLKRWNAMSDEEKEHVAEIVIATATTAATAVLALRRSMKSPAKAAGRKIVKKIARKLK